MEWWQDPSGAEMRFWNPASIQTSPEMEMFRALQQNPKAMMPSNLSVMDRFIRNPSASQALLTTGARLLQGRRPGQNVGGAVGESILGGANAYSADVDRRQKKAFLDTQQTLLKNQDVRAGKQDVRAEKAEGREAAAETRREGLFPLEKRKAEAEMTSAELGLQITQTYGLPKVKAELDLLAAQADEVRARAGAIKKGEGGATSADMQKVQAIAGALRAKNAAEGREAPDHEYVIAAFDYMRQEQQRGRDPTEIEHEWYVALKPDPYTDKDGTKDEKARADAKAIADAYRGPSALSLSDMAKNIGTPKGAPATGPVAEGDMSQVPTDAPGSNGYGNQQWPLLSAATPNMSDEALVASVDYIKSKDPGWTPPMEVLQRYNMLKQQGQLQAPMSF